MILGFVLARYRVFYHSIQQNNSDQKKAVFVIILKVGLLSLNLIFSGPYGQIGVQLDFDLHSENITGKQFMTLYIRRQI